jgi:hypothetical protein
MDEVCVSFWSPDLLEGSRLLNSCFWVVSVKAHTSALYMYTIVRSALILVLWVSHELSYTLHQKLCCPVTFHLQCCDHARSHWITTWDLCKTDFKGFIIALSFTFKFVPRIYHVVFGFAVLLKEWGRIRRIKSSALRHRLFKFSKSEQKCSVVKNE